MHAFVLDTQDFSSIIYIWYEAIAISPHVGLMVKLQA
jgi:hypothetical protein